MLSQNCKISLMFALYHIESIKIFLWIKHVEVRNCNLSLPKGKKNTWGGWGYGVYELKNM